MRTPDLSVWIQRFFQDYLSRQRRVSPATLAAYRDTIRLLFQYVHRRRRRTSAILPADTLTADTVLGFLSYLETDRGNTIRTRNARLASLRSLVHYLSDWLGPDLPPSARPTPAGCSTDWCT